MLLHLLNQIMVIAKSWASNEDRSLSNSNEERRCYPATASFVETLLLLYP